MEVQEAVTTDDKLLTQSEAAGFLSVEPHTLESWRRQNCGPRFVRYGSRMVRYPSLGLRSWLAKQMVETSR
jgi:predicted DNA-binding transcriptional regulator AlpA